MARLRGILRKALVSDDLGADDVRLDSRAAPCFLHVHLLALPAPRDSAAVRARDGSGIDKAA